MGDFNIDLLNTIIVISQLNFSIQDNLHVHAKNAAIPPPPPPNQGKNHIWKYLPDSACGANF